MQRGGQKYKNQKWNRYKQQLRIADPGDHVWKTHHRTTAGHGHSDASENQA